MKRGERIFLVMHGITHTKMHLKNDIKGYPLKRWIVLRKHHVRDKIGFDLLNVYLSYP